MFLCQQIITCLFPAIIILISNGPVNNLTNDSE